MFPNDSAKKVKKNRIIQQDQIGFHKLNFVQKNYSKTVQNDGQ